MQRRPLSTSLCAIFLIIALGCGPDQTPPISHNKAPPQKATVGQLVFEYLTYSLPSQSCATQKADYLAPKKDTLIRALNDLVSELALSQDQAFAVDASVWQTLVDHDLDAACITAAQWLRHLTDPSTLEGEAFLGQLMQLLELGSLHQGYSSKTNHYALGLDIQIPKSEQELRELIELIVPMFPLLLNTTDDTPLSQIAQTVYTLWILSPSTQCQALPYTALQVHNLRDTFLRIADFLDTKYGGMRSVMRLLKSAAQDKLKDVAHEV